MEDHVKEDLRTLFTKILVTYKARDAIKIKEISDETNQNSAIYQNDDFIRAAILFYALSKLVQRSSETSTELSPLIERNLERAKDHIVKNHISKYKGTMKKLFELISKSDNKLKLYAEELVKKAQINRGNKLYSQGLSLRRAARLIGVDIWALSNYVGKTEIHESETINALDRLKFARGLFK